jgi:hypothetical protein
MLFDGLLEKIIGEECDVIMKSSETYIIFKRKQLNITFLNKKQIYQIIQ